MRKGRKRMVPPIALVFIFLLSFLMNLTTEHDIADSEAQNTQVVDIQTNDTQVFETENSGSNTGENEIDVTQEQKVFSISEVPVYAENPYAVINDNVPYFTKEELKAAITSFETYSDLDDLGRCGVAVASVGRDIMPTEERGAIGSVKPTGWQTAKYDCVDGKYLYNRCHLLGFQLTGENANEKNLITGTRYMNVDGMLPFENMVADYVKETGNHVLLRVTPVFEGNNLVATGVLMEAQSVEDNGEGILFNVFCYNVQPEIIIDYATGESSLQEETSMVWLSQTSSKYHSKNDCGNMNPNKATQVTEEEALAQGKEKCSKCW